MTVMFHILHFHTNIKCNHTAAWKSVWK